MRVQAVHGSDGKYHVTGTLNLASATLVKKRCLSDGASLSKARALLAPISRYITGKCCDESDHITN
jgi:hypothetical protein